MWPPPQCFEEKEREKEASETCRSGSFFFEEFLLRKVLWVKYRNFLKSSNESEPEAGEVRSERRQKKKKRKDKDSESANVEKGSLALSIALIYANALCVVSKLHFYFQKDAKTRKRRRSERRPSVMR